MTTSTTHPDGPPDHVDPPGADSPSSRAPVRQSGGPSGYGAFLESKATLGTDSGFDMSFTPHYLFEFQTALVQWALSRGRSAILADCGLGKGPMALVWAENVARHTEGNVLILTPLAVTSQMVREGEKFDVEAVRSEGSPSRVTVANYERLHHFDPADYAGVVLDESSILKSFDGARRAQITEFMRRIPYRLLCTATAAPNDYIELGTSSEALGELGYVDMLNRFFRNDQNSSHPNRLWSGGKWRFKGHAEEAFWRFVASWARALRAPSDLGFSDEGFALPPLNEREHVVTVREPAVGRLFDVVATDLREQRDERRRSITERCEKAAEMAEGSDPVVIWCHLNAEGDMLADIIGDAEQVSGQDSDDAKEKKLAAFTDGDLRVLVIKPKIGAWGLNWQHCSRVVVFPSHSFEQYYQAVRRCWRFGQTKPVTVDIIASESEIGVRENLRRKQQAADRMFASLVEHMQGGMRVRADAYGQLKGDVPSWMS